MHRLIAYLLLFLTGVTVVACDDDEDAPSGTAGRPAARVARPAVVQISPPVDLATPPADAVKTASGIAYTTLVAGAARESPGRTATALIQYSGWRQRTGTTFFTTRGRGPISVAIGQAAPGLADVLPAMHKGEKVVVWVPPSASLPEPVVYEIELVDIVPSRTAAPVTPGTRG